MNPATPWARSFVDELIRAGVRHVCICPGSRSTPLVLAAAPRTELRTYVHLDERSAGFFALGIGKVTGRPAAVVTTSGTAVANLLPSVVEASQSETPLIGRKLLFGNPERSQARISPDSEQMSFLAPKDGVLNVFVAPLGELDKARAVTSDTGRGIRCPRPADRALPLGRASLLGDRVGAGHL